MKSMMSCVEAPGVKTSDTPSCLSSGMSSAGIVPPTVTTTSSMPCPRSSSTTRGTSVMCGRQDRQPDGVGVLLDDRLDDLLGRLVQAGVDDLHPGVTQRAGDDLRAAVVTVEPGLGDDDAQRPHQK